MMSVIGSSYFCSKTSSRLKSGVRFQGGGGNTVIWLLQVCAAEHKVLSIKQNFTIKRLEQFTFAIPKLCFQMFVFPDVDVNQFTKILDCLCKTKQNRGRILNGVARCLKQGRGLKASAVQQLYQAVPLSANLTTRTRYLLSFVTYCFLVEGLFYLTQNDVTIGLKMFFEHCHIDGLKPSTTALVVIIRYGTVQIFLSGPIQLSV